MKTKLLSLFLVIGLLFSLITGCADESLSASKADISKTDSTAVNAAADAPLPEAEHSDTISIKEEITSIAEASIQETTISPVTGAVLSKEEAALLGYDVQYGMYDYESPAQLPLSTDSESLSYWMYCQPYMMAYNINMAEATFFSQMEVRTGVEIDLNAVSFFEGADSFSLMIASGEYPDFIDGVSDYYSGGISQAIEDEVIEDFNSFMTDFMPNYSAFLNLNPTTLAGITNLDGSIGVAASVSYGSIKNVGPQIRADWLNELSLDVPVTYDQWYETLKAFKSAYGGTLWLDNNGSSRQNALSAGYNTVLIGNYDPFVVIDGTVFFAPVTEDYRQYLSMLSQWYSEGLIYKDYFTGTVSTPDSSLVQNGEIGIWVSDAGELQSYNDAGIEISALGQPRKTEDQTIHLYMPEGGAAMGTAISTQCDNLELAAAWLDYLYTYDGVLLCNYGLEGEGMSFNDEGDPCYTDLVLYNPDMISIACIATYSKYGGAGIFYVEREFSGYSELQWDAVATWSNNLDCAYEYPSGIQKTIEENELYSTIATEILTVVSEQTLRFINGDLSTEADWGSYLETLQTLRVAEFTELHQAIYDRFLENSTQD